MSNEEEFGFFDEKEEEVLTPEVVDENDDKLDKLSTPLVQKIKNLAIETFNDAESMINLIKQVKISANTIKAETEDQVALANKSHKAACDFRNKYLNPLIDAEKAGKEMISNFFITEGKKMALSNIENDQEVKQKLAEIDGAMAFADADESKMLEIEKDLIILSEVEIKEMPKISGLSFKKEYQVEVINKKDIPLEYMEPNIKALNKVVNATNGEIKIPGTKVKPKPTVSIRV